MSNLDDIIFLGKHTKESQIPTYHLLQRYIAPLSFGPPPPHYEKNIQSGTVYFLEGTEYFGVTCHHCIDEFRKAKESDDSITLRVNSLHISDIDSRIIDEDPTLDLATFRIHPNELRPYIPEASFLLHRIHTDFKDHSMVTVVGFPGKFVAWKNTRDYLAGCVGITEELSLGMFSKEMFWINFHREGWVAQLNNTGTEISDFRNYGGFSGSPVFFLDNIGIKLAGTVYAGTSEEDTGSNFMDGIKVRYGAFILEDGHINKDFQHN